VSTIVFNQVMPSTVLLILSSEKTTLMKTAMLLIKSLTVVTESIIKNIGGILVAIIFHHK